MASLIIISANGTGAGKTTLARRLPHAVRISLASGLREHLSQLFPGDSRWIMGTSDSDKAHVLPDGRTVREALIEEGAAGRSYDRHRWCHAWADRAADVMYTDSVVVDDLRTLTELIYVRQWAAERGRDVLHLHVHHEDALPEPFDDLSGHADYIITRVTGKGV
jgi:hypothetical protein